MPTFPLSAAVDEIRIHLREAREAGERLHPDLHLLRPGLLSQWIVASRCGLVPNALRQGVDALDGEGGGHEIKAVHWKNPLFTVDYGRRMLIQTDYAKIRRHRSFIFATVDDTLEVQEAYSVAASVVLDRVQALMARTTRNRIAWLPILSEIRELGVELKHSHPLPADLEAARDCVLRAQSLADRLNPPVKSIMLKGRLKELILADGLGHELVTKPKLEDARTKDGRPCEYLCSDRPGPLADFVITHLNEENLYRISRNTGGVFCATWGADLLPVEIWELTADAVMGFIARTVMPFRPSIQNQMHLRGRDAEALGELIYSR